MTPGGEELSLFILVVSLLSALMGNQTEKLNDFQVSCLMVLNYYAQLATAVSYFRTINPRVNFNCIPFKISMLCSSQKSPTFPKSFASRSMAVPAKRSEKKVMGTRMAKDKQHWRSLVTGLIFIHTR